MKALSFKWGLPPHQGFEAFYPHIKLLDNINPCKSNLKQQVRTIHSY